MLSTYSSDELQLRSLTSISEKSSFDIDIEFPRMESNNNNFSNPSSMMPYTAVSVIDDVGSPWVNKEFEGSLPEFNGSIVVPVGENISWYSKMYAYMGPGALVAVGYMDPGNWSTDIAGGSAYGYKLLLVVLLSSLFAMFLQRLALKQGLATGRDLAQACRDSYPKPVIYLLWVVMEVAICATDVAEVIGTAVALNLLFGLPLIAGVCITVVDVLILLCLNGRKFAFIETFVGGLILLITICFAVQLGFSQPQAVPLLMGFLPSKELFTDSGMLFIGVGIIGATVMPHNLFLHSSIILTRQVDRSDPNFMRDAVHFGAVDSTASLTIALFVNCAILMVAAATFHRHGFNDVATLQDAYILLDPILKNRAAPILFGIALLASGQNSTLTGTLAGQIVMEGFLTWKINPATRRMLTRLVAIVPSVIVTAVGGDSSANTLLIWSQVILSFALPFAVVPLVHITSSKCRMGEYTNTLLTKIIAVFIAGLIIFLNILVLSIS
mmetsp:Transcript_20099/g.28806  ORF Transcript_20099/g.28806 Transcript_20099/m.28806 type:complete len:497 (+) Transcript_20099:852-2342(+)